MAKLHLALKSLPKFKGLDNPQGRLIIAPTMDAIEFAYDHAKYGECSNDPVMEVVLPSLSDASAAPKGQHTLSAHVMYIPHNLKGDGQRQRAINYINALWPFLKNMRLALKNKLSRVNY